MKQAAFLLLLCAMSWSVAAQGPATAKITETRIANEGQYGPLFITVGGHERKIANQAETAWLINDGQSVVYSAGDGSGGFENEGQSLYIYDVRTSKRRKIMSEYYAVEKVYSVVTSIKKTVLLVTMADGGLGGNYVAVVDPSRGEVFFRKSARILSHTNYEFVLGLYKEDDWETLNSDDENEKEKVKPYKTERHNPNSILKNRVIINRRDKY